METLSPADLAAKKLNPDMLIDRRAVPETIARFVKERAGNAAPVDMTEGEAAANRRVAPPAIPSAVPILRGRRAMLCCAPSGISQAIRSAAARSAPRDRKG